MNDAVRDFRTFREIRCHIIRLSSLHCMRGHNLDAAREAKKLKAANRKITAQQRQITRLQRQANSDKNHKIDEYFHQTPPRQSDANVIYQEISRNIDLPPNRRRYSDYFRSFALLLMITSLPAYLLLRRVLPFPSRQSLLETGEHKFWLETGIVTSFDQLDFALSDYTRELDSPNGVKGILAVDAISLTPHMRIDKDGFVHGTVVQEVVSEEVLRNISNTFKGYEKFVRERANVTITDCFVYQFQPYNASIRCITVFVEASTTGKASSHELSNLFSLKHALQKFNLTVDGFAFDGDSAYLKMHEEFFNTYSAVARGDTFFRYEDVETPMAISDPLHLLKRARYRLVSKCIDAGMSGSEQLLNLEAMKEMFDVPNTVFDNSQYTKMHDDLPLKMFSLRNLMKLVDANLSSETAYLLPVVLLNTALKEKQLLQIERMNLLEVALYYMLCYHGMVHNARSPLKPQRSVRNGTVRMFTDAFVMEFCNTAASLLRVLATERGLISLNRIGSNPIEHLFGLIRMKSRDAHTFEKLRKTLGNIELHRQMQGMFGVGAPVNKRESYYAQTVFVSEIPQRAALQVDPRDAVVALMKEFGFPVTLQEIVPWDFETIISLSREISSCFWTNLRMLEQRTRENKQIRSTSECKLTCGRSILSRLCDKKILNIENCDEKSGSSGTTDSSGSSSSIAH